MSGEQRKVSVVIPAFNEETGLRTVLPKLRHLPEVAEVIVVDDGSTDETAKIAADAGARVLRQPYNKGYGASLKRGIREAKSDIIVIMDSDGQHDPDDIARLLEPLGEYDMVVGARPVQSSEWMRRPAKKLLVWVAEYLVERKIPDLNSGFRAFRRESVLEFMHILPNGFSITTTLTLAMMKAGCNVGYVPIEAPPRVGGTSSVRFARHGLQAALLIIRVITLFNPLKVFAPVSLFLLSIGSLYGLWGIVTQFRILAGAILSILAGLVIFFFGILADEISVIVREKK
jgi:glycosyltransferase involved in cell wall biosynthesis